MWLTRLALRNPIFILMMSLMTVALGWVSLTHLSVDMFPSIDIPLVQVVTIYTGAGPQDVEKSITVPIERAVSTAPGVDRVESVSKQGFSAVTVWFRSRGGSAICASAPPAARAMPSRKYGYLTPTIPDPTDTAVNSPGVIRPSATA